jgi:hypothetical protein
MCGQQLCQSDANRPQAWRRVVDSVQRPPRIEQALNFTVTAEQRFNGHSAIIRQQG